MKERLQKLLAQANIASRRASEELISAGRVRVNGEVAKLGDKADPDTDTVEVDGARLNFDSRSDHIYIALNKPKQVLSTDKPHRGDDRETVSHLIGRKEHLFSIGRLDADSEGLVVMTNDGNLAERLSHPRYRHTKTYRVDVLGLPSPETLDKWQRGVTLEDGDTAPCFVEITHGNVKLSTLRIVMTEGKKRQIRRVAALLGHPVRKLVRTHIGMYALGDLQPGQTRELTPKDVIALSTPSPEIKGLKATRRRNPADYAQPEPEEAKPKSRSRKPAPIEETEGAKPKPRSRKPAPAAAEPEAPPKRKPYRSRDKAHDDQWGKPPKPARKPSRRKDRSS